MCSDVAATEMRCKGTAYKTKHSAENGQNVCLEKCYRGRVSASSAEVFEPVIEDEGCEP